MSGRSRRIAAVEHQQLTSASHGTQTSVDPDAVPVTPNGPEVQEVTAQCWNCGSLTSRLVGHPTPYGRDLVRKRECGKCGTVYLTRERLRLGSVE